MATYYFDTSALAKRYLMEPGSRWVLQVMAPTAGHRLWIGRLAHVQLACAQDLAQTLASRGAGLNVVCADGELSDAARRIGLTVDIPTDHA